MGLLPSPEAALRRRLPLQPALHARVLADGNVEPQPRRALEMRTEDCARRQHDAVSPLASMMRALSGKDTTLQASNLCRKRSTSANDVGIYPPTAVPS